MVVLHVETGVDTIYQLWLVNLLTTTSLGNEPYLY
jgi:hypothetical protein